MPLTQLYVPDSLSSMHFSCLALPHFPFSLGQFLFIFQTLSQSGSSTKRPFTAPGLDMYSSYVLLQHSVLVTALIFCFINIIYIFLLYQHVGYLRAGTLSG